MRHGSVLHVFAPAVGVIGLDAHGIKHVVSPQVPVTIAHLDQWNRAGLVKTHGH